MISRKIPITFLLTFSLFFQVRAGPGAEKSHDGVVEMITEVEWRKLGCSEDRVITDVR